MLLPEILRRPGTPEYLLAVQDDRPHVLGAVSWIAAGNAITGIRVHVVPACRRSGVGSSLLRSVVAGAAGRGCRRATAVFDALSEPGAEPFLRSLGFAHEGTMEVVEAELDTARERVTALLERVKNSGRVPASARLLPFSESHKDQVAALHAGYIARIAPEPMVIGGGFAHSLERLTADCSVVLEVDGLVAGFILFDGRDPVPVVTAHVVRPEYRFGWADVLLLGSALEEAERAGARRFRFEIPDGNYQTATMARRWSARTVEVRKQFTKTLGGSNE